MLPDESIARWPPPQKMAAAPVPSTGCRFVVDEPARLVTDKADVERPLPDACPVVTTSFAGPVALAGTLTNAPACVTTVSDDPLIVTIVPFGALTVVPAGTFTEVSAIMVMLEPAAMVTGDVVGVVELELPDPPPHALKNTPHHTPKTALGGEPCRHRPLQSMVLLRAWREFNNVESAAILNSCRIHGKSPIITSCENTMC